MALESSYQSDQTRQLIRGLAGSGVVLTDIGVLLGLSAATLQRDFGPDLQLGQAEARARVAISLNKEAAAGNITAIALLVKQLTEASAGSDTKLSAEQKEAKMARIRVFVEELDARKRAEAIPGRGAYPNE